MRPVAQDLGRRVKLLKRDRSPSLLGVRRDELNAARVGVARSPFHVPPRANLILDPVLLDVVIGLPKLAVTKLERGLVFKESTSPPAYPRRSPVNLSVGLRSLSSHMPGAKVMGGNLRNGPVGCDDDVRGCFHDFRINMKHGLKDGLELAASYPPVGANAGCVQDIGNGRTGTLSQKPLAGRKSLGPYLSGVFHGRSLQ